MNSTRQSLIDVLRETQVYLARPGNDFAWSGWDGADGALAELAAHVDTLEAGRLPERDDLNVLFAPTGSIQEVSISSGWGEEFLALAERFDRALRRAYRWRLIAAWPRWLFTK